MGIYVGIDFFILLLLSLLNFFNSLYWLILRFILYGQLWLCFTFFLSKFLLKYNFFNIFEDLLFLVVQKPISYIFSQIKLLGINKFLSKLRYVINYLDSSSTVQILWFYYPYSFSRTVYKCNFVCHIIKLICFWEKFWKACLRLTTICFQSLN